MSTYLKNFIRELNENNVFKLYNVLVAQDKYIVMGNVSQLYVEFDKKTGKVISSNMVEPVLFDKIYSLIKNK